MNKLADNKLVDEVAWTTWNDAGYSRYSKSHLIWHDDTETALCGIRIPEEGNGIVIDELDDGACKNCKKAFLSSLRRHTI